MPLRRRHLILVVLITAQLLTGCSSWQVVSVSPRVFVDSAHVRAIQVEEKGGTKYILNAPRVAGDSLIGAVRRVFPADRMTRQPGHVEESTRAVPLAAVDHVAIRKSNALKTLGLIVGIPVVWFGLAYAEVCSNGHSMSC